MKTTNTNNRKRTNNVIHVYVARPMDDNFDFNDDEKIKKMAKKYGGEFTGSGAGFGMRDVDFKFTSAANVVDFRRNLKKLEIKGLVVSEMES